MEGLLTMSTREIDKHRVIRKVLEDKFRWGQAAEQLGLSERQIGRLCVAVEDRGHAGVIHGLRGKPSNHQLKKGLLERAMKLVEKKYRDFGPTFANEKLLQAGIELDTKTLRKAMMKAGLWKGKIRKAKHRAWRERRSCVGMLEQLDGSVHDWFEGRGPACVLLIYIDDATSKIMYGEFVDSEDTYNLMRTTKAYLESFGRPVALYVDMDSIYKINRQPTVEEQLRDNQPITQYTRAMEALGVEVICAGSPQAKGRVERGFKTHQDRLVKELRLEGISTMEEANKFLWKVYIPDHNKRCAVEPASKQDAHRPVLDRHDLDAILSIQTPRTVFNDFTVRYKGRFYQIDSKQKVRVHPKTKVLLQERLDGSIHLVFKGRYLSYKNTTKPACSVPRMTTRPKRVAGRTTTYIPPKEHPWRRYPPKVTPVVGAKNLAALNAP
jgi:hypothetical protein